VETDRAIEQIAKDQVTVVIPALNEAGAIGKVIEEVKAENYRNILVVDGYSTDQTAEIASNNGVRVLYQHGSGKAGAVRTALENVQTPYTVFLDADYTYDPKDIWRLLLHSEQHSQVIGSRDKKNIGQVHRFGNWLISHVFSVLFGVKVSDVCSGMYLLETKEAKKYHIQEPGFTVEIEIAAQSASLESLTEVPIGYRPRIGKAKLSAQDGLSIIRAAVELARRHNPILLYSGIASLCMIPAIVVLGWVVFQRLTIHAWHAGWALAGIMFVLVAVQAFTLASVSILVKHMEKRLMKDIRELHEPKD
jgi:glycosyltransferase involved in cell wall biosynthesis